MVPSETTSKYQALVFAVAKKLLTERGYSQRHIAGEALGDVREIVQQLLVMRPAPDGDALEGEELLYAQMDELLAIEQSRQTLVNALNLPSVVAADVASSLADSPASTTLAPQWNQIALWKGDITTLNATAIVNAANSALLGCFQPTHKCIDNVIHCKAGPRLRTACQNIMSLQIKDEPVGNAKITPGFALLCSYVIHTVGPQLRRGQVPTTVQHHQLQSCYTSSLDLLLKTTGPNTSVSIAFPCISTGLFAFPSDVAVPLVVDAVLGWLKSHPEASAWKVIFNTFLQTDHDLYKKYIESQHEALKVPAVDTHPTLETASKLIEEADYLLITAGAGLSAAAGLDYTSESVMKKFHAPMYHQGVHTMYHMVGRTDFPMEFLWGYYFKQIHIARLTWTQHRTAPTYAMLKAIRDRFESKLTGSTFIATTNADGMFGQEGFPLESVHTMQGDYGYIQCKVPCSKDSVFDIEPFLKTGLKYTNPKTYYVEDPRGIPQCPKCGGEMSLFLRLGHWFLESWFDDKKEVYRQWLSNVMEQVRTFEKKLVILEIGVGFNTPGILRLPDERLATQDRVSLVRINEAHPEIPFDSNGVGASVDANEALAFVVDKLQFSSKCMTE